MTLQSGRACIMSKDMKYVTLMDFYGSLLTEKQRNAMELYYYDDLSLSEIAEHTCTTRQGVHDSLKRAETYLDELENKLGFVESNNRLCSIVNKIEAKSNRIASISSGTNSQEVVRLANEVSQLAKTSKDFLIYVGVSY